MLFTANRGTIVNRQLLILKPGKTFDHISAKLGDFDQWVAQKMSLSSYDYEIFECWQGNALPITNYAGVVITGSHSMVTEDAFVPALSEWVRQQHAAGTPMLGICYGHQLIAQAFGGRVDYHPKGIEIGARQITLSDAGATDPLFENVQAIFDEFVTHRQSVLTLPATAYRLAGNSFEPNHAFRYGSNCWGVQFHPEFSHQSMKEYIFAQQPRLIEEGFDVEMLLNIDHIKDPGQRILQNFRKIVFQ